MVSDGRHVRLERGRGTMVVMLPENETSVDLGFTFAGDALVLGSYAEHRIRILAAQAPELETPRVGQGGAAGRAEEPRVGGLAGPGGDPIPALSILATFLVAFLLASWAVNRWREAQPRAPPRVRGADLDLQPTIAPPIHRPEREASGLVAAFSAVVRALRRAHVVPASMTAREMRPTFARLGFDLDGLVPAFEASRYGGRPESPGWTGRAADWAGRAWTRLRGPSP